MLNNLKKPLIIFELANNHMGDVEHGIRIIRELKKTSDPFREYYEFAVKLQLRDETIIHPDYRDRMDIKHIKRFVETRLSDQDFKKLKDEIVTNGFISMCTPFDEKSVSKMIELDFDIFKIASCSCGDWPLYESFAGVEKPIILSTGSADISIVDKSEVFFRNREKCYAILHCISAYPTKDEDLQINRIDFLKERYPNVTIGFSTHEDPNCMDSIMIALAKGAMIFEKHVGVRTSEYDLNAYSADMDQVKNWLESGVKALKMCGNSKEEMIDFTEDALSGVRQYIRGAFVNKEILKGERINISDLYFAMPNFEGQIMATEVSKYNEMFAKCDIKANQPVNKDTVDIVNNRELIEQIASDVYDLIDEANIVIPDKTKSTLSAHYGIENYYENGVIAFDVINREYCKKILVVLANQNHPTHYHIKKEETFIVLHGDLSIILDGEERILKKGDMLTVQRNSKHSFSSKSGCVLEEISTTHHMNDSVYDDEKIMCNQNRKLKLDYFPKKIEKKKDLKYKDNK